MLIIFHDIFILAPQAVLMNMRDLLDQYPQLLFDTVGIAPDPGGYDPLIIIPKTGKHRKITSRIDGIDHRDIQFPAGDAHKHAHLDRPQIFQGAPASLFIICNKLIKIGIFKRPSKRNTKYLLSVICCKRIGKGIPDQTYQRRRMRETLPLIGIRLYIPHFNRSRHLRRRGKIHLCRNIRLQHGIHAFQFFGLKIRYHFFSLLIYLFLCLFRPFIFKIQLLTVSGSLFRILPLIDPFRLADLFAADPVLLIHKLSINPLKIFQILLLPLVYFQ